MRKRNRSINFRLSEKEYMELKARVESSGLNLQSFVVNAVLNGRLITNEDRAIQQEILGLLKEISTQLHRMERVSDTEPERAQIQQMIQEVNILWQSLRRSTSQQKPMAR